MAGPAGRAGRVARIEKSSRKKRLPRAKSVIFSVLNKLLAHAPVRIAAGVPLLRYKIFVYPSAGGLSRGYPGTCADRSERRRAERTGGWESTRADGRGVPPKKTPFTSQIGYYPPNKKRHPQTKSVIFIPINPEIIWNRIRTNAVLFENRN